MNATHLGLIAGTLTSFAVIPQVARTFRTKHASDISIWQLILLMFGMSLWLVYGFCIKDLPLIFANLFSLICYTLLIVMKIAYDRANVRRTIAMYAKLTQNEKEES